MPSPAKPAAPVAAAETAPVSTASASIDAPVTTKAQRAHAGLPSLHALIAAVPAISLGGGFWLLIFNEVPKGNSEIVLAIGSGLLGYLTHAVQAKTTKAGGDAS
jgi:hypothetical protein